jgi:pimeloyl-ACP methyl ester carboxylesterase
MVVPGQRFWTNIRGLPMYGRAFTDGTESPPMVLVHGVGVSGRYLLPTAHELARHHAVYVPDLPGFGRSAKPAHVHTIPELADDLAAWMQALHVQEACLVGNSLGCQTIVDLVLRYPTLVRWAVLVGPTLDPEARSVPAQLWRGARDMLGESLRYWPLLFWDYLRAGTYRTLKTLQHAVQDPLVDKLPHVRVPTLVVRGTRDPIAPQHWVEEMAQRLPQGRLVVVQGATHVVNYTAPRFLAAVVRRFVRESVSERAR